MVQFGSWLWRAVVVDRAAPVGWGSLDPAPCQSQAVALVASSARWLRCACWSRCCLHRVLAAYRRPGWEVLVGCCHVLVVLVVAGWRSSSSGHLLLGCPQGSLGGVGSWGVGVGAWLCVFVQCFAVGQGGHLVHVPVCRLGGHLVQCRCRGGVAVLPSRPGYSLRVSGAMERWLPCITLG